jgi:hypothetical protein
VKVYVEFIVFEDGIGWSKGHTMRQDTKNPDKWVVDGLWIKRPISSLKNRYGKPRNGPPLSKSQYPSQAISFQSCSQNTNNKAFNYMSIGDKFFPSLYGGLLRNWALADDVDPSPTCFYRVGSVAVTCGSSPCSGSGLYCIAEKDNMMTLPGQIARSANK